MKRVRMSDSSLNSYGSRVLTSGGDLRQYERNPVLLYMHERGKVIGYMKDIRVDGDEITGEPVFDCATELSIQCKKQWEVGSLRMVSIGIDILATSEDPADLLPGQTSPSISRWKIFETSVVDIGANDNAITLRMNGKHITLGRDSDNPLPLLTNKPNNQTQSKQMELKTLAKNLGLNEDADESAVFSKINDLQNSANAVEQLRKEKEDLELAQISSLVDSAITENRITSDKKDHFINLGKQVGIETLKTTLAAMSPAARLSKVVNTSSGTPAVRNYKKLSEVPESELRAMRSDNPEGYKRLYREEYGIDCQIL